jgi:hypothetical protein
VQARGFSVNNLANLEKDLKDSIFFIGHIYPKLEHIDPKYKRFKYSNVEHPLSYITLMVKKNPPARIVFGGDSMARPTPEAMDYILSLKSKLRSPSLS